MLIAGAFVVVAAGLAALWLSRGCADCRPILCDDPCSLPTFGESIGSGKEFAASFEARYARSSG